MHPAERELMELTRGLSSREGEEIYEWFKKWIVKVSTRVELSPVLMDRPGYVDCVKRDVKEKLVREVIDYCSFWVDLFNHNYPGKEVQMDAYVLSNGERSKFKKDSGEAWYEKPTNVPILAQTEIRSSPTEETRRFFKRQSIPATVIVEAERGVNANGKLCEKIKEVRPELTTGKRDYDNSEERELIKSRES